MRQPGEQRIICSATLLLFAAAAASAQLTGGNGGTVSSSTFSLELVETLPLNRIDPLQLLTLGPRGTTLTDQRATVRVARDPFNTRAPGNGVAKGRATIDLDCFNGQGQLMNVGQRSPKFDRDSGQAELTFRVDAGLGCLDYLAEIRFKGSQKQPEGSSVLGETTVQSLPENADPSCFGSNALCLSGGRFKVELDWRNFAGDTGQAVGVPRTDDSGLFYFFDADNWEMLVKMVDSCNFTDRWWVFFGSATNVEFTLTVTDTQTSSVKTYFNPLGQAAGAITDTNAFATCP